MNDNKLDAANELPMVAAWIIGSSSCVDSVLTCSELKRLNLSGTRLLGSRRKRLRHRGPSRGRSSLTIDCHLSKRWGFSTPHRSDTRHPPSPEDSFVRAADMLLRCSSGENDK